MERRLNLPVAYQRYFDELVRYLRADITDLDAARFLISLVEKGLIPTDMAPVLYREAVMQVHFAVDDQKAE